jgi:hypothetical protein
MEDHNPSPRPVMALIISSMDTIGMPSSPVDFFIGGMKKSPDDEVRRKSK